MNLLSDFIHSLNPICVLLALFALCVTLYVLALTIGDLENWIKSKWSKIMKD